MRVRVSHSVRTGLFTLCSSCPTKKNSLLNNLNIFSTFFLVIFVPNKQNIMKRLTVREEEIMGYFWTKGPLFVKQLLEFYDEPKPHFNTLSTIVRGLEEKGFLAHNTFGNTYQYYAAVTEADYSRGTLKNVIAKYFNNSYLGVISSLVKEEEVSVEELKELIESIDNGQLTMDN